MFIRFCLGLIAAAVFLAASDDIDTASSFLTETSAEQNSSVQNRDSNNTKGMIGKNEKLDDVTTEDIAKEKELQEKVKTEKSMKEVQERLDAGKTPLPEPKKVKTDTITVKGAVLQGQVVELNSEYLKFSLIYGSGSIRINYADIEQLMTEHEYHIFYKGKETSGKIVGIKDHTWLIIRHGNVEELIKIEHIDRFLLSVKEKDSLSNRMHNLFPYTRGNIDIGMEYESGSNVKHKLSIATHIVHKVTKHRTVFDVSYAYEETDTVNTAKTLNKSEWVLFGEHDYYYDKKNFFFVQLGYDYDKPRGIKGRIYPALGGGHRFEKSRHTWLQLKLGVSNITEKFFPYDVNGTTVENGSNSYGAVYLGADARYAIEKIWLLGKLQFSGQLFYMPGFENPDENWLLRAKGNIALPIGETLALRFVLNYVNDNNPTPSIGNNKLTMNLYLSMVF
jgi:hypothetical protein